MRGVANFRDLGGIPTRHGGRVRHGQVLRSGHLAGATDEDLEQLQRAGVGLVVDLRGPGDIAAEGEDRLPPGADLVSIPMYDPARADDVRTLLTRRPPEELAERLGEGGAFEAMVRGARSYVTRPERVEQFAQVLHTLVEADVPTLVHCSAGKDRTGWAASVVLLALEAPEDAVLAHYLESNRHRRSQVNRAEELRRAGVDPAIVEPFLGVHEAYLQAALEAIEAHWGGVSRYLHEGLGLDERARARLRARLVQV